MWIPCVVWLAVLIFRLLLFSLSPIRCRNSIVASCAWAKENWVIANTQCACVFVALMLLEVVMCPTRVVFHVAVGAVDSVILLVDGWSAFLNPIHIFCGCLCGVFAEVLVDEELRVEVGISKVSPGQRCLIGVRCASVLCDLLLLLGLSRRSTVCTLGTSGFPPLGIALRVVLLVPRLFQPCRFVKIFIRIFQKGSSCLPITSRMYLVWSTA